MVSIPKVIGILSCGLVLSMGLSPTAQTEEIGTSRIANPNTIKGVVLRIEYGNYFVKDKEGKEVRLETNKNTQMRGQVHKGDRIEAKVDDHNRALSILSLP